MSQAPQACAFQASGVCVQTPGDTVPGGNAACDLCKAAYPYVMKKRLDEVRQGLSIETYNQLCRVINQGYGTTDTIGRGADGEETFTCPSRQLRFKNPTGIVKRFMEDLTTQRFIVQEDRGNQFASPCENTDHPDRICYECSEGVTTGGSKFLIGCFKPQTEHRHLTAAILNIVNA